MSEFIYVVREHETGYTNYYKDYEKAVRRARHKFDDEENAVYEEITEGRNGYWKGSIEGEFQLVWVEAANIF